MIPLIWTMYPIIVSGISFGSDMKCNFEQFAFSMPIKKSNYVYSKLSFSFLFDIFGALFMLIYMIKEQVSIQNIICIPIIIWIVAVLFSSIQLPFVLKYGVEKGRLIMVMTYCIIIGISSFLGDNGEVIAKIMEMIHSNSVIQFELGMIVLAIVIIAICIKISIHIMENKEY